MNRIMASIQIYRGLPVMKLSQFNGCLSPGKKMNFTKALKVFTKPSNKVLQGGRLGIFLSKGSGVHPTPSDLEPSYTQKSTQRLLLWQAKSRTKEEAKS